jgi:hypothetical protein
MKKTIEIPLTDALSVLAILIACFAAWVMTMDIEANRLKREAVRRGYGTINVDSQGNPRFQWLGGGDEGSSDGSEK